MSVISIEKRSSVEYWNFDKIVLEQNAKKKTLHIKIMSGRYFEIFSKTFHRRDFSWYFANKNKIRFQNKFAFKIISLFGALSKGKYFH